LILRKRLELMTPETPFVSVIVPVSNGERFLAEALESVLQQGHRPLEIVVVDDGSTDGTAAVVRRFGERVRYVHQLHRGAPAARNQGVRVASGNVIAFLDADDLWAEDKLAVQLPLLQADRELQIILGHTQLLRRAGTEGEKTAFQPWGEPRLAPSVGSAIVRREAFECVGVFDETQQYCDDVDWFLRVRESGVGMWVHPEVVLYYRRHEANITNNPGGGHRDLLRALKKSLDRRRG
jgi:glycosyltransferase involved in cell wall biosynthesis